MMVMLSESEPTFCPRQTLEADMAVEVFFLLEVVLGFVVGIYTSDGIYIQTYYEIAAMYVKSGRLAFDILTAAPITWAEWIIVFAPGCDEGSQNFAYIKAPLRYVKSGLGRSSVPVERGKTLKGRVGGEHMTGVSHSKALVPKDLHVPSSQPPEPTHVKTLRQQCWPVGRDPVQAVRTRARARSGQ
jgi:hypothetical protein